MENLYCIVYISQSSDQTDADEVLGILKTSRINNDPKEITGVLFLLNGKFMQILEGDRAEIESLYAKISNDPRHTAVTQLLGQPIPERNFGHWSMGFVGVDNLETSAEEGFWKPDDIIEEIRNSDKWSPAFEFLKRFYITNREA